MYITFYREIADVFEEVHQDISGENLLPPIYTSVSFISLVIVVSNWFFKGLNQCLMKGYKG